MAERKPVIHPSAPPNKLTPDELRVAPDPATGLVAIDPTRAGWRYLSFRVASLRADETLALTGTGQESVVVTLAGGGVRVRPSSGPSFELVGRETVFDDLPWAAYVPPGIEATIVGAPRATDAGAALVAIAQAPASGRPAGREAIRITPDDVSIEIRGAGNATRQINHIVPPDFPADRLLVVEVFTPAGNWSSWPPHKHDVDAMPGEAVLEEIYYYQLARPEGWGVQRLYRRDGTRDALWAVRHGELVLVTDGYHPFVATHGYDAYYLNALAGERRTMACSDDPDLAWTREAWRELPPDPRLPLVGRRGVRV